MSDADRLRQAADVVDHMPGTPDHATAALLANEIAVR